MTHAEHAAAEPRGTARVRCESVSRVYSRTSGGGWFSRQTETPVVTALDDVSLTVRDGELVCLTGPSGSGKSTLLHLLAGLDTPTSGTVSLAGTDLSSLSDRERTRLRLDRVGIVFQRFHLLSALSARANVALPLLERGVKRSARRARATDLLERVGLGDRITHKPGELSGGEQQRVAIARALANDPAILIADEPTGELDTDTGRRILDTLSELATERAVVIASHDAQTQAIADRIVKLRDGRLVSDG
ncbi:ABC transporter ATP-binding protein [Haladaptatus sp. YSMS36]|uniref:ABC transporter ATP-binding protein n=1 Tax=Haladaptatus sp. YSMS36 TaxID=3033384 RepID=UPI0023E85A75|nr:ABC transporter ATP-binding protein [Haladaptatus sp. YSMS36]